jgi:hypothetical protein
MDISKMSSAKQKKVNEAIFEFIRAWEGDFTIDNLTAALGGNRIFTGFTEENFVEVLEESRLTFAGKSGKYKSRERFFNRAEFIIFPTDSEILEGILIPGHRFLPFLRPRLKPWECKIFFEDNKKCRTKTVMKSLKELDVFYVLYGPERMPGLLIRDQKENELIFKSPVTGDENAAITVFDMAALYEKWDFTIGSAILCTVQDWNEGSFELRPLSPDEFEYRLERGEAWITKMEKGFAKAFDRFGLSLSMDEQIAYSYFHAGLGALKKPAEHLGALMHQAEGIHLISFGLETRLWREQELSPNEFIQQAGKHRKTGEPVSLNEILESTGAMFTKTEIEAYMRNILYEHRGEVNNSDLQGAAVGVLALEQLFLDDELFFDSDEEEEKFFGHIEKIRKRLIRSYNYFSDQEKGKIRREIISILDEHYRWMRNVDEIRQDVNENELPLTVFAGIVQIVSVLSSCLDILNQEKDEKPEELKEIALHLPDLRDDLDRIRQEFMDAIDTAMVKKKSSRNGLRIVKPGK